MTHIHAKTDLDAVEQWATEWNGKLETFQIAPGVVLGLIRRLREVEECHGATGNGLVTAMARVRGLEAENRQLWENLRGEQAESRRRIARLREALQAVVDGGRGHHRQMALDALEQDGA